jgi:spermidine/putrescine transport system permease protein
VNLSLQRRRRLVPYLLLLPGLLWLVVFFAIPAFIQAQLSLTTGTFETGYVFAWNFGVYAEVIGENGVQFLRSFLYAGMATVAAFIISFPLAYFIAFRAGRWRNLLLLLIVLPFFTSYLVRTIAWKTILTDNGFVVDVFKALGLLGADGRLDATTFAVVAGITYNYLPFMALPLYVSLEKIDRQLIEAATDLYSSRLEAFRRVTLPLALPGIFAGTLLTFIPAVGDFVNAALLGTPNQYMIGNVIQSKFLVLRDYPEASALSFLLMAVILTAVFLYARILGARNLTEAAP